MLSGGLTAHNLRDRTSFSPSTAKPIHKEFDSAIHKAINIEDVGAFSVFTLAFSRGRRADLAFLQPELRKKALCELPKHPGFRASHPREDHFVPLYVAAGAGEGGEVRTIMDSYGIPTFAFGL